MTASSHTSGFLFILSGPSGVGKSTIAQAVIDSDPNLQRSISHTSREQRLGEIDSTHYHFVSTEKFLQMRENGEFLESANVFGNYYGTSKAAVDLSLDNGMDTMLVIDWQGARNVRKAFSRTSSIFVLPPSVDVLRRRLEERQEDSPEAIEHRMQQAISEMSHFEEYDHVIINDFFDTTIEQIHMIIEAIRAQEEVDVGASADEIRRIIHLI